MQASTYLIPSEKLRETASAQGIADSTQIMRDYWTTGEPEPGIRTYVVGDMANNLVGKTTHHNPEIARRAGLPPSYPLNGGLIGSIALRDLGNVSGTGVELIESANGILRRTYKQLGMLAGRTVAEVDRAELFTGYLAHVQENPFRNTLTITGVGDVSAWVNGDHVLGEEKEIDLRKKQLEKDLLDRMEHKDPNIGQFITTQCAAMEFNPELCDSFTTAIAAAPLNQQHVYRLVDDTVTPWQIRQLQNNPKHPLGYAAVDGTTTLKSGIKTVTFPLSEITSVVLHTDGSQPRGRSVRSREDLVPANPTYGEQAIVVLTK